MLENLKDLDGIGETQILSLKSFFDNTKNIEIVKKFIKKLNIQKYQEANRKENSATQMSCLQGGFQKISRSS